MVTPTGAHNQFDIPEGSLTDKSDFGEKENSFLDSGPADRAVQDGLEERLVYALELNKGGINIEVNDFHGKVHVDEKDYDMLELIYDEYPKEREEVYVL